MRVVIFGGGFCGARVAKKLSGHTELEIVLVDKKDYFEYTPSVHKLLFDESCKEKIRIPFATVIPKARIVTDNVIQVTPELIETENEKITYDYLVIATGIDYPIFLENKKNVCVVSNGRTALQARQMLKETKHVLVIGGGLIGTEVAGELVTKAKDKRVVVVHPPQQLLERNPPFAGTYAKNFLERSGAEIIFGEKVVRHENNLFITDKGREIDAECAIWCAGVKCNPWFMQGFSESIFTERKALKVNEHLQLEGHQHIFVGGDINNVSEEKTAHNAERHADVIAKNIVNSIRKKPLRSYAPHSSPLLISLGDRCAILASKKFVFAGRIPALMKSFVEWWVLRTYR